MIFGKNLTWTLALCACLTLGGCKKEHSPEAMAAYEQAAITPAKGFGDLEFQKTTLRDFLNRFGQGRASVIISDEKAVELFYYGGEISYLFQLTPSCSSSLQGSELRQSVSDLGKFIVARPACGDVPLSSLSFKVGDSFYADPPLTLKTVFDLPGMNGYMAPCTSSGQLGLLLAGDSFAGSGGCLEGQGVRVHYSLTDEQIEDFEKLLKNGTAAADPVLETLMQTPVDRVTLYMPQK